MSDDKPKVKGYRQLTDAEIAAINKVKAKAEEVGGLVEQLRDVWRIRPTCN